MYAREATRDPDDLYGDQTVAVIEVRIRRNGAMSVAGSINDEAYAVAMLQHAIDSVRDHNARKHLGERGGLLISAKDTGI
jgi:hypothetical protein